MAKTHFDPYTAADDDPPALAPCGTVPAWDGYHTTGDWRSVTCQRCLAKQEKLNAQAAAIEADIVSQMGTFVEYHQQQRRKP